MGRRLLSWLWLVVVLCAKETKTRNRTYSHFIRINTWQDSDKSSMIAPLPFIEFLARSSLLSAPRPSAAESSSDDERTVTKRQVDPLHSCIEAKCSSWNSGNYLDCVYRHCVSGFQVHGKRSADTEEVPEADSFDQPEGRFLLLPVVSQSSDGEPQLFPQNVLQPSNDVVAEEERREPVTRPRMAHRRTPPGSRYHRRMTLGNSRHRMKRHAAAWNGLPLRANVLPKRSYNDIADVCVEHHCGQLTPHSISYFQCVQNHCTGK